jgi:hypothetical protein
MLRGNTSFLFELRQIDLWGRRSNIVWSIVKSKTEADPTLAPLLFILGYDEVDHNPMNRKLSDWKTKHNEFYEILLSLLFDQADGCYRAFEALSYYHLYGLYLYAFLDRGYDFNKYFEITTGKVFWNEEAKDKADTSEKKKSKSKKAIALE